MSVTFDTDAARTKFARVANLAVVTFLGYAISTLAASVSLGSAQAAPPVAANKGARLELRSGTDLQGWDRTDFGGK